MLHTLKRLSLGGPSLVAWDQIITSRLSKRTHAVVDVPADLVPAPRVAARGLRRYLVGIDATLAILAC